MTAFNHLEHPLRRWPTRTRPHHGLRLVPAAAEQSAKVDTLRASLDAWLAVKTRCLLRDHTQLLVTGSLTSPMPTRLVDMSRAADADLYNSLGKISAGPAARAVKVLISCMESTLAQVEFDAGVVVTADWVVSRLELIASLVREVEEFVGSIPSARGLASYRTSPD